MPQSPLIIVGAGRHGKELAAYLQDPPARGRRVRLAGFVDEAKGKGPFSGSKILGGFSELRGLVLRNPRKKFFYITATGNNRTRMALVEKIENLKAPNLQAWTYRHPGAFVGRGVEVGEGTCLVPGTILTADVRMGRHCIVNVKASVSHDCSIGDFVNLNPGVTLCGDVRIGKGCYIGAGATVIDKVSIGEWTVIGAGAVVVDDLPPRVTAVGVPARVIKRHPA